MKAMLLPAPAPAEDDPLLLTELPSPEPGPGEVRLRVRACGVCRTDLHIAEGDLPLRKLPVVPGHEVVGVVDRLGAAVTRLHEGDRVGVPWLHSACGVCKFCQSGRENLCEGARFTGYDVDGGYAEQTVVPESFAYPLPEGFSDIAAAPLMCAGVIGLRALRLSGVQPGSRLGMYGFGASAHVTIQIACYEGVEVYVFSRGEEHRRLATDLGAVWVGQAQDNPPGRLDSTIIFAPAGWLVPEALRVLEKGGTLVLAGITMTPVPELGYDLLYGERVVRSVANSTRQDVEELLHLAAQIPVHTETQRFPLAEANRALQLLKQGRMQGAGVLAVNES